MIIPQAVCKTLNLTERNNPFDPNHAYSDDEDDYHILLKFNEKQKNENHAKRQYNDVGRSAEGNIVSKEFWNIEDVLKFCSFFLSLPF